MFICDSEVSKGVFTEGEQESLKKREITKINSSLLIQVHYIQVMYRTFKCCAVFNTSLHLILNQMCASTYDVLVVICTSGQLCWLL